MAKLLAAVALSVLLTGCVTRNPSREDRAAVSFQGEPLKMGDLLLPARATSHSVQLATAGAFEDRFWAGVNLGSTTPGHLPGEVSARANDYRRWFPLMGELGVRVIRIYTLLDPSFYSELRAYNLKHPNAPLYVIHGVWIPEERFLQTGDLYDPALINEQRTLLRQAHAAVFGQLTLPRRRGHASGRWTADISRWVIAWSPGVEWDPDATERSQRRNQPRSYDGKFIRTRGRPTSTEAWIAQQLDYLAGLDAARGWSRAITFTNWLTADPLAHPHEPLAKEDRVSVDAMHLQATAAWPGGFFASYHVYPYYPDFLRWEPRYRNARDPYAAYLTDLQAHHRGQALMVTEFGVPTSLGKAHLGLKGRDQGGHSERRAAEIDADMLAIMRRQGLAGGVLFEWVDEWFKFTWNTIDEELPGERRALWRNVLTNEEHFGVLAAEPQAAPKVVLDGDDDEWVPGHSPVLGVSRGPVREIRATHDAAYLYLRVRCDTAEDCTAMTLGFDVRPGLNGGLPGLPGAAPNADVAVTIKDGQARLYRAAWTDSVAFQYGLARPYLRVRREDLQQGSGVWREPQLILNRPYRVPVSGQRRGVELHPLNPLPAGAEREDRRNLLAISGKVMELRVPWALLGFADPSSRAVVTPHEDGTITATTLPAGFPLIVEAYSNDGRQLMRAAGYRWEQWQTVQYHERRKDGWPVLKRAFADVSR